MVGYLLFWLNKFPCLLQVRKGHSKISQEDIVDVLDKQLLEGMGVLLTEEEQQKSEESVSLLALGLFFILYVLLSMSCCTFLIMGLA